MKKLFTNDKFFLAIVLASIYCALFYYVAALILWPDEGVATQYYLLYAALVIGLYVSYKKHAKNVMKGLMGATLMAMVTEAFTLLGDREIAIDFYFGAAYLALTLVVFINHFIINSEHRSKPINVAVNQVLLAVMAVVLIVWDVLWIPYCPSALGIATQLGSAVLSVGLSAIVVCIESRLDAYRKNREAAGWTEEKGYPKSGECAEKDEK